MACTELLRRRHAARNLDQATNLGFGQALEMQLAGASLARKLRHDGGQWCVGLKLGVSVGADDQQRSVGRLARDEAQEKKRRLVGRMKVVQEQDQRPVAGGLGEQRRHRLE